MTDSRVATSDSERRIGNVVFALDGEGRAVSARLAGRVLILTQDKAMVRRQLAGEALPSFPAPDQLYSHVSTDAIIKANPDCYYYDERLGERVLRTLGGGGYIEPGELRAGQFAMIVAGDGWGEGSSREVAALALLMAGIGAVCAPTIAPIHRQNLINNGMLPITDQALAACLGQGETVSLDRIVQGWDTLSERVLRRGGLLAYMRARDTGLEPDPTVGTAHRPMTIAEKIMASHMTTRHGFVQPGDDGFVVVDAAFSHDYTTAPAAAAAEIALGRPIQVRTPERIHAFPDHLTLADQLSGLTAEARAGIADMRSAQQAFAQRTGIHWHGTPDGGSEGICHTLLREQIALPGQVILGTDSHTCSAGALNCLAYGIGNSEIASVWEWNCVSARVPATVRINLSGVLAPSCTAKDVILHLARVAKEHATFTGKVMEFGGPGLAGLSFEEQAVLTNMAVECNALTALCEPTAPMIEFLQAARGMSRAAVEARCIRADPDAVYDAVIDLDLSAIQTLVALPGHPGNGVPLDQVRGTALDIAYGGSCTAGDLSSIRNYAKVLRGRQVCIPTYIQYGSQAVMRAAQSEGLHEILVRAGVEVITQPGCGACVNAGPGGPRKGQTAISATNRNMPGRMGDGDVFLSNPSVLAASAVLGRIAGPEDLAPLG